MAIQWSFVDNVRKLLMTNIWLVKLMLMTMMILYTKHIIQKNGLEFQYVALKLLLLRKSIFFTGYIKKAYLNFRHCTIIKKLSPNLN